MPDVDVDFDDRRRGEVIRYVTEKYGDDRVAQIVTYGTIKAKQALKDSARVLGMPFSVGDKLTKAMPPADHGQRHLARPTWSPPTAERYKEAGDFRTLIAQDAEAAKVFETARGIENLKRQWGVHAAGVIMSAEPLIDVLPMMKREDDGAIITQFDQPPLEDLGLLKMDFLGLRNLTVIQDALNAIERNTGTALEIEAARPRRRPADVRPAGARRHARRVPAGRRADARPPAADEADQLRRHLGPHRAVPPGPDGHELAHQLRAAQERAAAIDAIHPELAEPLREILDPTFGVIVYQEQVMAVAQKVAGFSLGQADILRKAMGKKKKSELDKQFADFEAGMLANGYSKQAVQVLWDTLMPFADYAFNKAHSAGYGVLSYWTAYLKANHPAEYMAALLTSVGDSKDKLGMYLNECRRMGIQVLPPDVNESAGDFTAVPSATGGRRHPLRAGRGAQRRHRRRRGDPRCARGARAGSRPSTTSCARCRSRSRTSAPSSR